MNDIRGEIVRLTEDKVIENLISRFRDSGAINAPMLLKAIAALHRRIKHLEERQS